MVITPLYRCSVSRSRFKSSIHFGYPNFRVIATDLAADVLPLDGDQVDESQLDVVSSSDNVSVGNETSVNPDLPAGSYVLICNVPTHYGNDMYLAFEVTAP